MEPSQETLRIFIEQCPFAMAMFDNDLKYITASLRWIKDFNLEKLQVVGVSHYEVFPEIPDRWKEVHKRCLAGATETSEEDPFYRADGTLTYLRWEVRPWRNSKGNIGGLIMFSEDITQRIFAEKARDRFVSLADASVEFIGMCDENLIPYYINPAGLKMVGADDLQKACKMHVQEYFFPEDQDFIVNEFFPRVIREGHGEIEIRFRHLQTGEPIWMLYNVFNLFDENKKIIGWATVSRNISDRKKAEEQVKERVEELARSNSDLEQFAYVASHDLRSPIKSILNWSQVLEHLITEPKSEKLNSAIHYIQNNSIRALNLVDELLGLARVNSRGETAACVDTNQMLKSIINDLKQEIDVIGARIKVGILPELSGKTLQLERVFKNLIQNALIYRDKSRPLEISVGCKEKEGFFEFFVADNGIGIEKEYYEKIFEIFSRLHSTKDYPAGTGIGLSICKRVIEYYGGQIWVDSKVGVGSTFYFTYPKQIKVGLN